MQYLKEKQSANQKYLDEHAKYNKLKEDYAKLKTAYR